MNLRTIIGRDQTQMPNEEHAIMVVPVGEGRYAVALKRHCRPGEGPSKQWDGPGNHIRGAGCEYAGSIMLNLCWRPYIGELKQPDIGGFIEVRSATSSYGVLTIKPKDRGLFMLVVQRPNLIFLGPGFYSAEDAKRDFKLDTEHGDPAYRVPQSALRPLDDLRVIIATHEAGRARFRLRTNADEENYDLADVAASVRDRRFGDPAAAGRPGYPAEGMART